MGLDMYLTAERYFTSYVEKDIQKAADIKAVIGNMPDSWTVSNVETSVMYWRKANAIHKWFVDNVQDGVDNCEKFWLKKESLEALKEAVDNTLAVYTPENAAKHLPSQSGFFFGSTEYDEWYWKDVENTKKFLDELLPRYDELAKQGWDFYYQASW